MYDGTQTEHGASGQKKLPHELAPGEEPVSECAASAKATLARLIRNVYETDPFECPRCEVPLRVIALIKNAGVIRRILEPPGALALEPFDRCSPTSPSSWPRHAVTR